MIAIGRDSRGIADTVGYILIVGIIIASIAAVYYVGFDILNTSRDIEEDQNIERSLSILASNENEVIRGQAPSRSTQVRLGDNEISTTPVSSRMYINIPGVDSYSGSSSALTYSSPTSTYYYEMGAIVRVSENGNVASMSQEPNSIRYIPETDSLHIQIISASARQSQITGGFREIVMTKTQNDVYTHDLSSDTQVELYITSPRTLIWKEYYENQDFIQNCEPYDGREIVCYTEPVDEISVQKTSIRLGIY